MNYLKQNQKGKSVVISLFCILMIKV